jgi:hypothetical protein
MAVTHKLIQTLTAQVGSVASFDFTSIPGTYTDLKLVCSLRNASVDSVIGTVQFNGLSTNLSSRLLAGSGSAASSTTSASLIQFYGSNPISYTSSVFGNVEIYVPNYAGSTNKSVSIDATNENNATASYMSLTAGLWSSTAAITRVTVFCDAGNAAQYSSVSLYGIKNS